MVTLAQIPMPIKIVATFQNNLRPNIVITLAEGESAVVQGTHRILQMQWDELLNAKLGKIGRTDGKV